mmetsp:Transcript_34368/g.67951  ORF Transcript_34368/g.67951 Transcript_34368/m.67951 type:complete len:88 (-) Transcript_34368:829-1092(-)
MPASPPTKPVVFQERQQAGRAKAAEAVFVCPHSFAAEEFDSRRCGSKGRGIPDSGREDEAVKVPQKGNPIESGWREEGGAVRPSAIV